MGRHPRTAPGSCQMLLCGRTTALRLRGQDGECLFSDVKSPSTTTIGPGSDAIVPRRWDAAALADFASLSSTVACECPRHVAELLMQLSHFEDYSAQCRHRSPADAELHAFLGRVAAEARASFEAALEQVALHEGLLLPPSVA